MDIFATMKISASALKAQRIRMNAISSNLANIETTRTPDGGPYRKREVVFQSTTEGFANTLDNQMRDAAQGSRCPMFKPAPGHLEWSMTHLTLMPMSRERSPCQTSAWWKRQLT